MKWCEGGGASRGLVDIREFKSPAQMSIIPSSYVVWLVYYRYWGGNKTALFFLYFEETEKFVCKMHKSRQDCKCFSLGLSSTLCCSLQFQVLHHDVRFKLLNVKKGLKGKTNKVVYSGNMIKLLLLSKTEIYGSFGVNCLH